MIIKLKIIIKLLVFSGFFLLINCNLNKKEKVVFLVAGHAYGSPLKEDLGLYTPLKNQINYINNLDANFMVLTGDMVKYPTSKNWEKLNNDLKKINIPIYKAPGNHDMGDRKLYKQKNGNSDSLFSINGHQFIVLDNTKNGWGLDLNQLNLLNLAIKKSESKKGIFIFCHNVMWYKKNTCFAPNSLVGKAPEPYFNYWNTVEPILKSCKKPVYIFAGDVGAIPQSNNVAYLEDNNIHYITSGMGNEIFDNFLEVSINNEVVIKVILLDSNNNSQNIVNFTCH